MKRAVSALMVAGLLSLVSATASATPPSGPSSSSKPPVSYQKVAKDIATRRATDAYRRGPEVVAVTKLPSDARRGDKVVSGSSTYTWRGTAKRGKVVRETDLPGGSEQVTQKRGVFRNVATLSRETTERGADGRTITTTTEAKTRGVTFWRRGVKASEKTRIEIDHADGMNERTYVTTTKDPKHGVSVEAETVVLKPGGIRSNGYGRGHDVGSTARISSGSPDVEVTEKQLGPKPKNPSLLELMDPQPDRPR